MSKIETFGEAVRVLNIEDYSDRIINSNSRGELFHCVDYIMIANAISNPETFKAWFDQVVQSAEKHWERPESVFQHIPRLLEE